jgi:hypothetical protein
LASKTSHIDALWVWLRDPVIKVEEWSGMITDTSHGVSNTHTHTHTHTHTGSQCKHAYTHMHVTHMWQQKKKKQNRRNSSTLEQLLLADYLRLGVYGHQETALYVRFLVGGWDWPWQILCWPWVCANASEQQKYWAEDSLGEFGQPSARCRCT